MRLDNLGQLISKYPQLKKCSVEMLECLDFTQVDDNFDITPYILVDGEKLAKKFIKLTSKNPYKCTFNGKDIVFGCNSMTLVIVDDYNEQKYQIPVTDYPNILNSAIIYYSEHHSYYDWETKDCIISQEMYSDLELWISNLEKIGAQNV